MKTKKAVPLEDPGNFGTGLTVRVTDIKPVKGKAHAPGEIAGPALKVTVVAQNRSDEAIDLSGVVVFLASGKERRPAAQLSEGTRPLRGRVAADEAKTGTYVYTVPENERDRIRVEISYSGEAPTVAFEGRA